MADTDIKGSPGALKRKKRGGSHKFAIPGQSLTTREREVCDLLALGLALKEVAYKLNITINTADHHRTNAYQKLGVHNRVELVKRLPATAAEEPVQVESDVSQIARRLDSIEEQLEDLLRRLSHATYMPPLP
ncbi:MAG TPA: helix-turn-helix transcriptional regulator [Bryobacteraceae bacterium]|nr:helix-turn-helix transcriptional regulator [Bryobacteraceae bacterium]